MWRALALLLAAGCDKLFDVASVGAIDAPIDAPQSARCASFAGATPTNYTQPVAAVALPHDLSFEIAISRGAVSYASPIDAMLSAVIQGQFFVAALRPDGGELFLAANTGIVSSTGSGTVWSTPAALAPNGLTDASPGTPAQLPSELRMIARTSGGQLQEWTRDAGGAWSAVNAPMSSQQLTGCAIGDLSTAMLSTDARLVVFAQIGCSTNDGVWFAQRAGLDRSFGAAEPLLLNGAGQQLITPYVTDDCSQLYAVDALAASLIRYVH